MSLQGYPDLSVIRFKDIIMRRVIPSVSPFSVAITEFFTLDNSKEWRFI
jgi:hypothetical protein